MAPSDSVDGRIVDAVSQTSVQTLGSAPAQAGVTEALAAAQAIGLTLQNALANQHRMQMAETGATVQAINLIFHTPIHAGARATGHILGLGTKPPIDPFGG